MLSFIFVLFTVSNAPLLGMLTPAFEQEFKKEGEYTTSGFYPNVTPESRFLKTIRKICDKKIAPGDKAEWYEILIGIIKDHHELMAYQKVDEAAPLGFAFNRGDVTLTSIFAQAERLYFPDDFDSQKRLNAVLYSAVKAQKIDMVNILLTNGASTHGEGVPDLLNQLVLNCTVWKQGRLSCCVSKNRIDPQQEESARKIAELLVQYHAPLVNAFAAANELQCRGVGCARIRELGLQYQEKNKSNS